MEINIYTLLISFIIPITIALILRLQDRYLSNDIVYSTLVMSLQLSISAGILTFVFTKQNIFITITYLIVMLLFSFKTLNRRISKEFRFKIPARVSIASSTLVMLIILLAILSISKNVFSPRYIIPLFGMLLGNTTTATVLASNQIHEILNSKKESILTLTYLGVPMKMALEEQLKNFVSVALTPTLTSMLNIGVVSLPGMMTGQILAGELPLTAVSYQLMIMFFILGSISMSVLVLKHLTIKNAINKKNQLV